MIHKLTHHVREKFRARFAEEPVMSMAPGRINLIGEHVDYNDGFVFPAAIDRYVVAAVGRNHTRVCQAVALDLNEHLEFSLDQFRPLHAGGWRNYVLGVVDQLQNRNLEVEGFNFVFSGNIPSGSGLSSSAALENSIVVALNALFDLGLQPREMIEVSQQAEHQFVGVKCGIMDQFASMFGRKDQFLLLDCRSLETEYFPANFEHHEILLINTNVHHNLSDSAYNDRRASCERVADILGKRALRDVAPEELEENKMKLATGDYQKAHFVIREIQRTQWTADALRKGDLHAVGELLYQSHQGLSEDYQVSCPELDFLVQHARTEKSILGARMMGGGFGGCTINLIEKGKAEAFLDTIRREYTRQFGVEFSEYSVQVADGARIIK